jgi:hypothetical protein
MHWALGMTTVLTFFLSAWKAPSAFVAAYPYSFLVLFCKRVADFRKTNELWFLMDYCYFSHVATIGYLWLSPSDHPIAIFGLVYRPSLHVFISAAGFTAHGVWAWRNLMAFDDPQRLTSTWLHLCPNILLYLLRYCLNDKRLSGSYSTEEFVGTSVVALGCFVVLLVLQLSAAMWAHTYFRSEAATGVTHVATKWCGVEKKVGVDLTLRTKVLVAGLDLLYMVATNALSFGPLRSEVLHRGCIVFMVLVASWNGYTYAQHKRAKERKAR